MIHTFLISRTQPGRKLLSLAAVAPLIIFISSSSRAQQKGAALLHPTENGAALRQYRGIQLGMTSEEVRKKLGSPKDKADDQDFFVFNDSETAQILYDKAHQVITISADYMKGGDAVPNAKDFLGTEAETKPDGSVYKVVRNLKAGYWLSYNRTAGPSPLVTITMQKIEQ